MPKRTKKSIKTNDDQRKHNRGTRGNNTSRRPIVWDTMRELVKDENGVPRARNRNVEYPNNTQWDWSRMFDMVEDKGVTHLVRKSAKRQKALDKPFDSLLVDSWGMDIEEFAKSHGAKIAREVISPGVFRYSVMKPEMDRCSGKMSARAILTIETTQSLRVGVKKKKFAPKGKRK